MGKGETSLVYTLTRCICCCNHPSETHSETWREKKDKKVKGRREGTREVTGLKMIKIHYICVHTHNLTIIYN